MIVVIAILATLTIVSYNVVQTRSKDTKIRTAAEQIQSALDTYVSQKGRAPRGGWGSNAALNNGDCTSGSSGWFAKGLYVCTVEEVLVAADLIPSSLITSLPPNKAYGNNATTVFMLYTCGSSKIRLMWYLESPSAEDVASYDADQTMCGGQDYRTVYGMRASATIDV